MNREVEKPPYGWNLITQASKEKDQHCIFVVEGEEKEHEDLYFLVLRIRGGTGVCWPAFTLFYSRH